MFTLTRPILLASIVLFVQCLSTVASPEQFDLENEKFYKEFNEEFNAEPEEAFDELSTEEEPEEESEDKFGDDSGEELSKDIVALAQPNAAVPSPESERKNAYVRPMAGKLDSYAGYLKVNSAPESKLFYWFFESDENASKKPILLWLHGDLGRSSLMSVFEQHGPYKLVGDDKVELQPQRWTKKYNILYIDSVVGIGFSSTKGKAGYSKTAQQAAINLWKAMNEFLLIHDKYETSSWYLGGESHAAKFILALATHIHKENVGSKKKISLKGVSIGGGVIDPPNQQVRAEYLYQMGIADAITKLTLLSHETQAKAAIARHRYGDAKSHHNAVQKKLNGAGFNPTVDVVKPDFDLKPYEKIATFYKSKKTREEIHAGNAKFEDNPKRVVRLLEKDIMFKSSSNELVDLLKNYKVCLYTGQFDLMVPTSQLDNVIHNLKWDYKDKFIYADREKWNFGGSLVGYVKKYDNLRQFMVREANRYAAHSQPDWLLNALSIAFD